ncbi:MAG: tetratricopeptide repeat protein, partial [Myxococcota bacterium]|nr:tetratricopeptide repeat protein [Myxococcota bacterium]
DRFFCGHQYHPVFGQSITKKIANPAFCAFVSKVIDDNSQKLSIADTLSAFVALRNDTTGHGTIDREEAFTYNPLLQALLENIIALLPDIKKRIPVLIRHISVERNAHTVQYLSIIGTGKPSPKHCMVKDYGILEKNQIYLWRGEDDEPILLSPLMFYRKELFYMLSKINKGIPCYTAERDENHEPDELILSFKKRAPWLLERSFPHRESQKRRDTAPSKLHQYQQLLLVALEDGVISSDEEQMLIQMQKLLGLRHDEVANLHEKMGYAKALAARNPRGRTPSHPKASTVENVSIAKARSLEERGNFLEAIACWKKLLQETPSDQEYRLSLLRLLMEVSAFSEVERVAREGIMLADSSRIRTILSRCLFAQNYIAQASRELRQARNLDPKCLEMQLEEIQQMLANVVDYREILVSIQALKEDHPNELRVQLLLLGTKALLKEDYTEVLDLYYDALEKSPHNYQLYSDMVSFLMRDHQHERAIQICRRYLERNPLNDELQSFLSFLLLIADVHKNEMVAKKHLNQALELNPRSSLALQVKAYVELYYHHDSDAALREFRNLLSLEPSLAITLDVTEGLPSCGAIEQAISLLNIKRRRYPNRPKIQLTLIDRYYDLGDYALVLQEIDSEEVRDFPGALSIKIKTLLELAQLDEVEKLLPNLKDGPLRYMCEGRIFLHKENYREAGNSFAKVLEYGPNGVAATLNILCLNAQGRSRKAEQFVSRLSYVTNEHRVCLARGLYNEGLYDRVKVHLEAMEKTKFCDFEDASIIAKAINEYPLALKFAQWTIEQSPDSATGHRLIGDIYLAQEEWDTAEEHYIIALDMEPENRTVLNNYGYCHEQRGRYHRAMACYKEASQTEEAELKWTIYQNMLRAGGGNPKAPEYQELCTEILAYVDQFLVDEEDNQEALTTKAEVFLYNTQTDALSELLPKIEPSKEKYRYEVHVLYNKGERELALQKMTTALEHFSDPWMFDQQIILLCEAGRMRKAEQEIETKGIMTNQFRLNLAQAYLDAGDTEKHLSYLKAVNLEEPCDLEAAFNVAQNGNCFELALRFANAVLAEGRLSVGHLLIADLKYATDDWEEAEKHYRMALEFDPNNFLAHNNFAFFLENIGLSKRAIEHFQLTLQTSDESLRAVVLWNLARNCVAVGQLEDALSHVDATLAIGEDLQQLGWFVHNVIQSGMIEDFLPWYEQKLGRFSKNAELHRHMCNALFLVQRVADSHIYAMKAVRLAPKDARMHKALAVSFERQDKFKYAHASYKMALRCITEENKVEVQFAYADFLIRIESHEEAKEIYQRMYQDTEASQVTYNWALSYVRYDFYNDGKKVICALQEQYPEHRHLPMFLGLLDLNRGLKIVTTNPVSGKKLLRNGVALIRPLYMENLAFTQTPLLDAYAALEETDEELACIHELLALNEGETDPELVSRKLKALIRAGRQEEAQYEYDMFGIMFPDASLGDDEALAALKHI